MKKQFHGLKLQSIIMSYVIEIESNNKTDASIEFRKKIVIEYEKWYKGKIESLYGEKPPSDDKKIKLGNLRENSILTWAKIHQENKYLKELKLNEDVFTNKTVLDIGSGGIPSALIFKRSKIICLDPLLDTFKELDYPFKYYNKRSQFIKGFAEKMPFPDNSFDAIISVNAIDHFNDLKLVSSEIKRVLKKDGLIRIHIHYHKSTILEPIELNDEIIKNLFGWCNEFKKITESSDDFYFLNKNEKHTLWSNF